MAVISTTVPIPAGVTSSNDIVTSGGEFAVASGGAIVGTIVAQHGETVISAGGTATGTTVQNNLTLSSSGFIASGGQLVPGGVAISTLVASGGFEAVFSGGVTSGALVLNGGVELVGNYKPIPTGLAVGMTLDGGGALIGLGGTASGTTVTNGGMLFVLGGVDSHASVVSGGTINVATDVLSSGSTGTDGGASVSSGGTMNVSAGASASAATVGSSGTLNVSSGGVVSGLTTNDPNDQSLTANVNVLSGGTVSGGAKLDGGMLTMGAGAVFQASTKLIMTDTAELVLGQNSFKGTIKGFSGEDFMDLTKIKFIGQGANATTETFTQTNGAGGLLQVAQGNHVASLHLTGTYSTANFGLQSDGIHGTTVTFVPSAAHG
jgi:autotransporter passenger strand-loop-strand repeat protein